MDHAGDLHLITARQAIARRARGERVAFVDARTAESLARSGCRVPGALRVEPGDAADAEALQPGAVLVVYGDDGRVGRAEAIATALRARGHDARALAGGFAAWSELRCPTELAVGRSRPAGDRPRKAPAARPALRLVFARP
jgi:Fe-Mn family superoxide dismutase